MIERKFIEKGIRNSEMETFLNNTLERADYSHSDIKRTPLNTRIVIYAGRPGVVIGHAGSKINEMTEALKKKFKIDNPQIEVKSVDNVNLDPKIVAKQIASSLERGMKHRQIVNIMIKKIMGSGAIGVEITISGKISGSRSRTEKFMNGYLKKCGNTADVHTLTGFEKAVLKAGLIGVKVKLMTTMPSVLSIEKRIMEKAQEKETEKKEKEQQQKEKDQEKESKDSDKEEEKTKEPEENKVKKDETEKKENDNKEPSQEKNKQEPEEIKEKPKKDTKEKKETKTDKKDDNKKEKTDKEESTKKTAKE